MQGARIYIDIRAPCTNVLYVVRKRLFMCLSVGDVFGINMVFWQFYFGRIEKKQRLILSPFSNVVSSFNRGSWGGYRAMDKNRSKYRLVLLLSGS